MEKTLQASLSSIADFEFNRPRIQDEGRAAVLVLFQHAKRDTGQSRVIARFLLGLYDGNRFPFDLTDFRKLDLDLFKMCQSVLAMDYEPKTSIADCLGENGCEMFEQLAKEWGWASV